MSFALRIRTLSGRRLNALRWISKKPASGRRITRRLQIGFWFALSIHVQRDHACMIQDPGIFHSESESLSNLGAGTLPVSTGGQGPCIGILREHIVASCEFLLRDLKRLRRVFREIIVVRNQLMVRIVSEAGFPQRLSLKFRESTCSFRSSACPLQGFREGVRFSACGAAS